MKITDTIKYVGVNDHKVDLFEGQYPVANGMAYNSYVILDEKIAVMDTVDANFTHEWLDNLEQVLDGRKPDYLIVQHMEPDHAANVANFLKVYPDTTVVANVKTFQMIYNFFGLTLEGQKLEVTNGGTLSLGNHQLTFVFAPMVHWPEVMVTYDSTDKVLFSADGFGKFGALDVEEDWDVEARCRAALDHWGLPHVGLIDPVDALSGGERTKLCLAGISVHDPSVILLDEPTNHLDTSGRRRLYDLIRASRATIVAVSHDVALLNLLGTTCELSAKGLKVYGGDYDFYRERKRIEEEALDQQVLSLIHI